MAHKYQNIINWLKEKKYEVSFIDEVLFYAHKHNLTTVTCSINQFIITGKSDNHTSCNVLETKNYSKKKLYKIVKEKVEKVEEQIFLDSPIGKLYEEKMKRMKKDFE